MIIAATEPVAGSGPSGDGPVTSGLVAMNRIEAHSENTAMIGDRMDTDVVAGIEAGLETVLVLTGSTRREDVARYPFRPSRMLDSIADVIDLV